jgi:hypothetical protein
MTEIRYARTKRDAHNNNRVLRLAKSTKRVFAIHVDRKRNDNTREGKGYAVLVKNGREYNPWFDVPDDRVFQKYCQGRAEYGKTLEELINENYNLKFAGYHGDGRDAYWNNYKYNTLDLVVQMRLLER